MCSSDDVIIETFYDSLSNNGVINYYSGVFNLAKIGVPHYSNDYINKNGLEGFKSALTMNSNPGCSIKVDEINNQQPISDIMFASPSYKVYYNYTYVNGDWNDDGKYTDSDAVYYIKYIAEAQRIKELYNTFNDAKKEALNWIGDISISNQDVIYAIKLIAHNKI